MLANFVDQHAYTYSIQNMRVNSAIESFIAWHEFVYEHSTYTRWPQRPMVLKRIEY
jgi:hypothetical protein